MCVYLCIYIYIYIYIYIQGSAREMTCFEISGTVLNYQGK